MNTYKCATLVIGDDWQGIYANGKLQSENHRIVDGVAAICKLLQHLEVEFSVIDSVSYPTLDEYLEKHGSLPERLSTLIEELNGLYTKSCQ